MNEKEFDQLWTTLMEPIRALETRISDLSRQSARAEVAGALEVVSALPSAGKQGRLLWKANDGAYADDGTAWGKFFPSGGTTAQFAADSGGSISSSQIISGTSFNVVAKSTTMLIGYAFCFRRASYTPRLDIYRDSTTSIAGLLGLSYLFKGVSGNNYSAMIWGKDSGLTVGTTYQYDLYGVANATGNLYWPAQTIVCIGIPL